MNVNSKKESNDKKELRWKEESRIRQEEELFLKKFEEEKDRQEGETEGEKAQEFVRKQKTSEELEALGILEPKDESKKEILSETGFQREQREIENLFDSEFEKEAKNFFQQQEEEKEFVQEELGETELSKKKKKKNSLALTKQRKEKDSLDTGEEKRGIKSLVDRANILLAPSGRKDTRDQVGINRQILKVAYLFAGVFLVLMVYIGYFVSVDSKEIITNPRNQRQDMFAKTVIRGNIESSDGEILAETKVNEDGEEERVYPFRNLYAHVVGYTVKGKYGLESSENFNLLTSNANFLEKLYHTLKNEKNRGDTVVTTLNSRLQEVAYEALGDHKGAVIAMEPSSGKILAMVSKPDFDPNSLSEDWAFINSEEEKENSRLLNRATQGIYPPGSIFKIVTALEYMRENSNFNDYHYDCESEGVFFGVPIHCYNMHRHGEQDLKESFANSCNTSFANIGTKLDKGKFHDLCESLLFNQALPVEFPYKKSRFVLNEHSEDKEVAQTAIGQGDTGITPLHSVMITSAVANGGMVMKPYLVDQIENYEGGIVRKYTGKSYGSVMSAKEATELTEMMKEVVKSGTGTKLSGKSYSVAGKTGTAEYEEGKNPHAWFTGFAPADNPEIAISVIVEDSGAGSTYAVPVAGKVLDAYFSQK